MWENRINVLKKKKKGNNNNNEDVHHLFIIREALMINLIHIIFNPHSYVQSVVINSFIEEKNEVYKG